MAAKFGVLIMVHVLKGSS